MAEQKFNATLDHYGSMLERGRVLIIDYDVTRYHSFDIFRYLLLDHDRMMDCNSYYLPMIAAPMVEQQLVYYYDHCPFLNPYDNFVSQRDSQSLDAMEKNISDMLGEKYVPVTETQLASQFMHIFDRDNLDGYMLRYRNDPHHVPWESRLKKVYQSDRILDMAMARHIIKRRGINLVIASSIDIAVMLALIVHRDIPERSMSFLTGSYHYNMDDKTGMLKNLPEIMMLERAAKYDFGIFQPFVGLDQIRDELEENFKDDQH